jgi:dipeptidase
VIFGKNSDRDPNEAHEVVRAAAAEHAAGTMLRCTYIDIPQAAHTYAVLLAKPFWIWGAEMGANERGVVIGNEAVFTRLPYQKEPGLIGMDLLRLGLERGATAEEALHVITDLLARYGQGGNCGFAHPMFYHNSFLIADLHEAWVLETAGQEWAAEKVHDTRSISNQITIGSRWDLASPNLVTTAIDRGWCRRRDDFHFARCYSDFIYTRFSAAGHRRACTMRLLESRRGDLTVADGMAFLRTHGLEETPGWRPDPALMGAEVCSHTGAGPIRISQSTGSMVAHLTPDLHTYWMTATSAPCTGVFKPVWLDAPLAWQEEPAPTGVFDPACLWWRHELLHRTILRDYPSRIAPVRWARAELEGGFIARVEAVGQERAAREALAAACYQDAEAAEKRWLEEASAMPVGIENRFYYNQTWSTINRQARLSV